MAHKALIVAIERYANPRHNLPGLSIDVEAINRILGRYGIGNTTVLRDSCATSANIKLALNSLVEGCQPGDVCIFYYTGHGVVLPPHVVSDGTPHEGYVPYEGTTRSFIADTWINEFLTVRLPEQVFFYGLYDSCYSGHMFKFFDDRSQEKNVPYESLYYDGTSSDLGSGTRTKQFFVDPKLKNSVHIGAAQRDRTALVLPIRDGITTVRRSAFTWALEQVAHPGITIGDLETQLTASQATVTTHHSPVLSTSEDNKRFKLFN